MDLLSILPNFSTKPYAHILPPLERSNINTVDLITLDTLEIAKRAHVPPADVRRLSNHVIKALHHDVGFEEVPICDQEEPSSSLNLDTPVILGPRTKLDLSQWCTISTLDPTLDTLLGGGIPIGYVTEVTGESGSGKTQFLLNLLLAVQLPQPRGAGKSAIYISTEAPLATTRLSQLLDSHPYLSSLPRDGDAPSLERILSINAMDLETQDHILNYQLPVAIKRYKVGLVVIDSITSNYRAEHTSHNLSGLSTRSGELGKLGQMLRNLAINESIAIVVANQVSDRFDGEEGPSHFLRIGGGISGGDGTLFPSSPAIQPQRQHFSVNRESGAGSPSPLSRVRPPESGNAELTQHTLALPPSTQAFPSSSPYGTQDEPQQPFDGSYLVGNPVRNEILSLRHQQRFFTGWGDCPRPYPSHQRSTPKTPALGLVWSTQIACRIALKKEDLQRNIDLILETKLPPPASPPPDPVLTAEENEEKSETLIENSDGTSEPDSPPGELTVHPPSPPQTFRGRDATPATAPAPTTKTTIANPPIPPQSSQTPEQGSIRRTMKLVFAPWAAGSVVEPAGETQDEVEFELWKGGMRGYCSTST